jgi:hypothetical protein
LLLDEWAESFTANWTDIQESIGTLLLDRWAESYYRVNDQNPVKNTIHIQEYFVKLSSHFPYKKFIPFLQSFKCCMDLDVDQLPWREFKRSMPLFA